MHLAVGWVRWIFGSGTPGPDFDEHGAIKARGPPSRAHERRNPGRLPEGRDGSGVFRKTPYTGHALMSRFNPQITVERLTAPEGRDPVASLLAADRHRITGPVPSHARARPQKESPRRAAAASAADGGVVTHHDSSVTGTRQGVTPAVCPKAGTVPGLSGEHCIQGMR